MNLLWISAITLPHPTISRKLFLWIFAKNADLFVWIFTKIGKLFLWIFTKNTDLFVWIFTNYYFCKN